nr:adenine glycosylase [Collinsella tanakaei]
MVDVESFRTSIRAEGSRLYRDLPWRRTRDPYAIWLSEVMLQQTQVPRVLTRWQEWLERFPSVEALAAADTADVLAAWQGMGYNRRALALKSAAEIVTREHDGVFPPDAAALRALPGIGPATAQGIRAFAFDLPGVYLETNVRTVLLHHFFPDVPGVSDRELIPLAEATCPASPDGGFNAGVSYAEPQDEQDTPRSWYYALLDYGAYLKKTIPNPSRRSSTYTRQSRFEGSRRQKRAHIVRMLLDARASGAGALSLDEVRAGLDEFELGAGRERVGESDVVSILDDLVREGFARTVDGAWIIA